MSYSPDTDTSNIDYATAESPVGIGVSAGQTVTISDVTGLVSHGPCCALVGPTGDGSSNNSDAVTANGFTERVAPFSGLPFDALVGVFFNPSSTTNSIFLIGDGGSFTAPAGTTELYLGVVDTYQWNNNSGAFTFDASVPEPAAWALMLVGFGAMGAALRSRRRTVAA